MNPATHAVIGANYGDEGKGLMTDYLVSTMAKPSETVVVRFNGGAQAGHTVVDPVKGKHVFSHVGSGALQGASTYLSEDFICNPVLLEDELAVLGRHDCHPKIYADLNCRVTTPFDMIINQVVESSRAERRHGSVGVGINETVERCKHSQFDIRVRHLEDGQVIDILKRVQDEWVPRRLSDLGITGQKRQYCMAGVSDVAIRLWSTECLNNFKKGVQSMDLHPRDFLADKDLIFEGAQGLCLDQNSADFPHVTRSNTGIRNVVRLLSSMSRRNLRVTYVTRAYLTRHGAGPLPNEWLVVPSSIYDTTNVPHLFQGTMRFAPLDVDALLMRIENDLRNGAGLDVKANLAVTCTDQLPSIDWFPELTKTHMRIPVAYSSSGPTRADVKEHRHHGSRGGTPT